MLANDHAVRSLRVHAAQKDHLLAARGEGVGRFLFHFNCDLLPEGGNSDLAVAGTLPCAPADVLDRERPELPALGS